jgi:hypothetical protein
MRPARKNTSRRNKAGRLMAIQTTRKFLTAQQYKPLTFPRINSLIDEFSREQFFSSLDTGLYPKELGLRKQVRRAVITAKVGALVRAEWRLIRQPEVFLETKRLFEDLRQIVHLLDRNENFDDLDVAVSIEPRDPWIRMDQWGHDATRDLKSDLEKFGKGIKKYLHTFQRRRPASRRNLDPLSSLFISDMFSAWRMFRHQPETDLRLHPDDRRHFARFLAAGWRDVGFPLTDHRGHSREPLEEWFADRIRKQFAVGI